MTVDINTVAHANAVLGTLESLAGRFHLPSMLGLTDTDFEAAMAGNPKDSSNPRGTIEHLEFFGVAALLRDHLKSMGWTPPSA